MRAPSEAMMCLGRLMIDVDCLVDVHFFENEESYVVA